MSKDILSQDTKRESGKDAQRMNIYAAKLVSEAIRSTLGPKGMDKMLVDGYGNVTVTNDGVTILREIEVDHPAAKMIVEVAKTQEAQVGDGTTTAVILAGQLLEKAQELLDNNIHPTIIARGYRLAEIKAQEILLKLSKPYKESDLQKISETAMTGKGAEEAKELLSKILLQAIKHVSKHTKEIDSQDIKIEKKVGGKIKDTSLIRGVVLDKEKTHSSMPTEIKDAKIALIDSAIEIRVPEADAKVNITSPSQIQSFLDMEEEMIKKLVNKIISTGANVVLCQKGIDELAQHFFAQKGIYAVRRVRKSDMARLSKATNAKIITDIKEMTSKDLGYAGNVKEVKVADEYMTYITNCKKPAAVSIIVRGSTEHIADEVKRALEDALGDLISVLRTKRIVAGAAATEMQLSKQLLGYSQSLAGREQLAVKAFCESLNIIPKTLAENAGLDPIDVITKLQSAHEKNPHSAINVYTGNIMDSYKKGIIEPLEIKTQAISSATDVAIMILRIDDVILASKKEAEE